MAVEILIRIPSSRLICEAGLKMSLVGKARTASWDHFVIPWFHSGKRRVRRERCVERGLRLLCARR
jgi:hypothetical protein